MAEKKQVLQAAARAAGPAALAAWEAGDTAALCQLLIPENIALVGFMGTGKSTVCAALHQLLAADVVDTDEMVERDAGMPISEIFARQGETAFRDMETAAVKKAAALRHTVISCGGGAVLRPENVAALQAGGHIVLLTAKPETILERVKDDDTRPKLRGKKNVADIATLMAQREPAYRAAAQIVVETDGKTAEEICREILMAVQQR